MRRRLFNVASLLGMLLWLAGGMLAISALCPDPVGGTVSYYHEPPSGPIRHVIGVVVVIVVVVLVAVIAIMPFLWVRIHLAEQKRERWNSEGKCPNCGYDLRVNRARCPECGTPVAAKAGVKA